MADVRSPEVCAYDVFLSFRGEDTRKAFVDHLYTALVGAGLRTFRDNEGIERGENIKSELEKGIVHSRCSIIVLSQKYSSSTWCLDELVTILERKRKDSRHVILPIFYHVDPSDVRKQKGSFGKAFVVHESKMELKEKVKRWRDALKNVADLGGMSLANQADGHEAKFIQKVVKVIADRLQRTILSVPSYLVGIESRVKHINSWLQDGSTDVGIVALCGMSGVGKTTIAKYVFNLHFERFEATSFLANIREVSGLPDGLIRLQTQLLSDILKGKKKETWNVDEGTIRIRDALRSKKVLLVLDDMDHIDQFEAILGMCDSLHPGSKIIITTKHTRLLPHESYKIHNVEKMNYDESTRLFSWHAFGQDYPFDSYKDLSERVVMHCGGLPLALKVLGSSLRGNEVAVWKSALEKLESIPDHQIFKKLVISYDSLPDDHDKNLFLEIACFFVGKDKDYMVTILDGCGFYTIVGIQNLVDRCMLTMDWRNKLVMHQMVQEMGKEVIRKESPKELGKRTRLWRHKDSFHVLSGETGTETITGLTLDMTVVKQDNSTMSNFTTNHVKRRHNGEFEDDNFLKRLRFGFLSWHSVNTTSADSYDVYLTTDAFTRMSKLSLLQINYTKLIGTYEEFPMNVKWLCWRGFSKHSIPIEFPLESLVAIDMRNSRLEQVWKGCRFLGSLKILNLSHSHELISTPNFSSLPQLERLILKDCVSLVEVHESIGTLETKLVVLNLKDCKNLWTLPRNICMLKVLETLVISGCSNLVELPQEMRKMESLKVFHADKIKMYPPASTSTQDELWKTFVSKWVSSPRKCPKLSWDSLPKSLVRLSLSDCNLYDNSFPPDFTNLPKLKTLNLSNNPICSLPDCIRGVTSLNRLVLHSCSRLEELIDLPGITELEAENCTSLEKITFQSNGYLCYYLFGCKKLVHMEGNFKLEPIYNMESEVLKNLGLDHYGLEALTSAEMKMYNVTTWTQRKFPIQGLFENGIISIFLPGGEVPSWFSNKSLGSSVSVTFPYSSSSSSNTKIQGLQVCTVYAINEQWSPGVQLFTIIHNETKNLKFIYSPTCHGIPKIGEYIIWLSHWKFRQSQLNEGDQLHLSMLIMPGYEVKEVGIHLVYADEEKRDTESSSLEIVIHQENYSSEDFVPIKVSTRQGTTDIIALGYMGFGLKYILPYVP